MIELKYPCISYKGCEIISGLPEYIAIHDEHIEYKWKTEAKKDNDGIPETRKYLGQKTFLKKHIQGVEAYWSQDYERYCCNLILASNEDASCWIFETFEAAVELKDKIQAWLLKPDQL